MLRQVVDQIIEYCSREDTRLVLETKLLRPALHWVLAQLRWCIWAFTAVAALVAVQTALLLLVVLRTP